MNNRKRCLFLVLALVFTRGTPLCAQQVEKAIFLQEMQQLKQAYASRPSLSFDMAYFYYNEHAPEKHLDSLIGHVDMAGNLCRMVIDSTETIATATLNIMLFKEDKIMYLAKGPSAQNLPANPANVLDSMLAQAPGATYEITVTGNEKIYRINFPAHYPCKRMDVMVRPASNYITRTVTVAKTDRILNESMRRDINGKPYEEYTVIETRLYNYRGAAGNDTAMFTESSYFTKEGKEYKVTDRYKEYKIYLGTPGL